VNKRLLMSIGEILCIMVIGTLIIGWATWFGYEMKKSEVKITRCESLGNLWFKDRCWSKELFINVEVP
jgi:hypothetical protein